MRGWILDFSVQENKGLITTEAGERYTFTGRDWQDSGIPEKGLPIDFEAASPGIAVRVYRALGDAGSRPAGKAAPSFADAGSKPRSAYSPVDWYMLALRNYANFNGRSDRPEYWFYLLGYLVIMIVLSVIDTILFGRDSTGLLANAFVLFSLVPAISVGVRRLHDIGKSGWWLFIVLIPVIGGIVLLVWSASKGDSGSNGYGQPPG